MSLNTNGWDFIYTAYLNSVGTVLRDKILFTDLKIKYSGVELKFTNTKVAFDINTTKKTVILTVTCDGTTTTTATATTAPFNGLKITITLKLDWVNKENKEPAAGDVEVEFSGNPPSGITVDDLWNYFETTHTATNTIDPVSLTQRKINPFYNYFKKLAFFSTWMEAGLVRIGWNENPYATSNDKKYYVSFCYMLSTKKTPDDVEKAFNNNPAYVDLNAIPEGASSALIIERGVFAEYMVKAAFGKVPDHTDTDKEIKPFDGDLFKGLEAGADLKKAGTYAFSNNKKLQLKSTDYKNEDDKSVSGTVEAERLLLSVEESNIKLSMGDVEYVYNEAFGLKGANKPTINQEYVFDLEWKVDTADATKSKIVANGKEKLFIISNDFGSDSWTSVAVNIAVPILKNVLLESLAWAQNNKDFKQTTFIKIEKGTKNETKKKLGQVYPLAKSEQPVQNVKGLGMNLEDSVYDKIKYEEELSLSATNRKEAEAINLQIKNILQKKNENSPQESELSSVQVLEKCYLTHFFNKVDEYLKICEALLKKCKLEDKKRKAKGDPKDFQTEIKYFEEWIEYFNSINTFANNADLKDPEFIKFYDRLLQKNKLYKEKDYKDDSKGYTKYDYDQIMIDFEAFKDFDQKSDYYLFKDPTKTGMWTTWQLPVPISTVDTQLKQKYSKLYSDEWTIGNLKAMPLDLKGYGFIRLISNFFILGEHHSIKKFKIKQQNENHSRF